MAIEMDPTFADEVMTLHKEIERIVKGLRAKIEQPKLFEEAGNYADRIYGTAATLGMEDFAAYLLSMKQICYQCGQSESTTGQKDVLDLLYNLQRILKALGRAPADPASAAEAEEMLKFQLKRAQRLQKGAFHGIQRKTVA